MISNPACESPVFSRADELGPVKGLCLHDPAHDLTAELFLTISCVELFLAECVWPVPYRNTPVR
jgi:hypothetical protein